MTPRNTICELNSGMTGPASISRWLIAAATAPTEAYSEAMALVEKTVSEPTENVPPAISLPSTLTARYNRTFTVTLTATDADGDALNVWLDWGDSTAMTAAVPGTTANSYVATHVYEVGGSVTLTIYADDGTELIRRRII